mmetsp:Transcript_14116/g.18569  ORF Transcript_14116/g.18569 Transcript_14116/m.18569 type:complete len:212 (+) Transcript_14116:82-717(+)
MIMVLLPAKMKPPYLLAPPEDSPLWTTLPSLSKTSQSFLQVLLRMYRMNYRHMRLVSPVKPPSSRAPPSRVSLPWLIVLLLVTLLLLYLKVQQGRDCRHMSLVSPIKPWRTWVPPSRINPLCLKALLLTTSLQLCPKVLLTMSPMKFHHPMSSQLSPVKPPIFLPPPPPPLSLHRQMFRCRKPLHLHRRMYGCSKPLLPCLTLSRAIQVSL